MKRLCCLILALAVFAAGFSGCAAGEVEEYPLTVNGTPLEGGVFRYYLDLAFADPALPDQNARITYATGACIRYVAINSAFAARGLALTPARAAETAQEANALWRVFGLHYAKVGVSKQTYLKLRLNLAYTEALRYALYDTGGVSPLPEETMKAYFGTYYAAFKFLHSHLYNTDLYGRRVEYSEAELAAVKERYAAAAAQVNSGVAIDFVYSTLIGVGGDEVRQSLDTAAITDGDPAYPEEFYTAVQSIAVGKAGVCIFGDEIYLVNRVDPLADDELFKAHRDACLKAVSEPYLLSEINTMCNAYTSVRKSGAVQRCYETVRAGRQQSLP